MAESDVTVDPTVDGTATESPKSKSKRTPKAAAPKAKSRVTPHVEATPIPAPVPRKARAAPKPTKADALRACRQAAILLKQASDPTRLQVLLMLVDGPRNVGVMANELGQSQPACSHHLALLRHGRLIEPQRRGKENWYMLTDMGRRLVGVAQGLIGGER